MWWLSAKSMISPWRLVCDLYICDRFLTLIGLGSAGSWPPVHAPGHRTTWRTIQEVPCTSAVAVLSAKGKILRASFMIITHGVSFRDTSRFPNLRPKTGLLRTLRYLISSSQSRRWLTSTRSMKVRISLLLLIHFYQILRKWIGLVTDWDPTNDP